MDTCLRLLGPKKIFNKISYKDYNLSIFAEDRPFYGNFEDNSKKSLKRSKRQESTMIHTKPVIFVVISIFAVTLIYSSFSTITVFAVPPDARWLKAGGESCSGDPPTITCCWREKIPGQILGETYCQTCTMNYQTSHWECDPKELQFMISPPTTGETVPPGGGVAEQPEQPPLFGGQNDAGVPPTGGIEQPPTATTQPAPGGGANVPTEGGTAEQPTAPQDDNQGGGLPTIKNQENVPPGGGVAEQPEDDGQQEDSEGVETAGPLT